MKTQLRACWMHIYVCKCNVLKLESEFVAILVLVLHVKHVIESSVS